VLIAPSTSRGRPQEGADDHGLQSSTGERASSCYVHPATAAAALPLSIDLLAFKDDNRGYRPQMHDEYPGQPYPAREKNSDNTTATRFPSGEKDNENDCSPSLQSTAEAEERGERLQAVDEGVGTDVLDKGATHGRAEVEVVVAEDLDVDVVIVE